MKRKGRSSEIAEVLKLSKELDSTIQMITENTEASLATYGYGLSIAEFLNDFTVEQVEEFTPNFISNIYNKYKLKTYAVENLNYDEFIKTAKDTLMEVKKISDDYNEVKKSYEESSVDILANLEEYRKETEVTPESYIELKEKLLNAKKEAEENNDAQKMKEAELGLTELEIAFGSLDLMSKRIKIMGEKEIERLITSCFDEAKSAYVFNKFKNKMTQAKIDIRIGTVLNFEERFLDEKYHSLNNFLMYSLISHGAYMDTEDHIDVLFVRATFGRMIDVIYNKIDQVSIDTFLHNVQEYLDLFIHKTELFDKLSLSSPNNPSNIARRERERETGIEKYREYLKEHKVNTDSTDINELRELYRDAINRNALMEWLSIFDIKYNESMTYDELLELKNQIIKPKEDVSEELEGIESPESNDTVCEELEDVTDTNLP